MAEAIRLHRLGEYPEHNLYGAAALERIGHQVLYLAPGSAQMLLRANRLSHQRLGDIDQQIRALRAPADVIFSGADGATVGLGLLRRGRLLRRSLVGVWHSPPRGRLSQQAALGYDLTFALSRVCCSRLINLGRSRASTLTLKWGPDVNHPVYKTKKTNAHEVLVVSAGKSDRDIATLNAALGGRAARIHGSAPQRPYLDSLADMAVASVVAIPFSQTDRMLGLTELNDALAFAKPVIMTRSAHIDVDIEEIGCGFWVEPGDTAGWREALTKLDDLELARNMGRRGREFAEREWNSDVCGRQITDAIADLV
jgi:hypothetical protein